MANDIPDELIEAGVHYNNARRNLFQQENNLDALWRTIIAADGLYKIIDRLDQPPF